MTCPYVCPSGLSKIYNSVRFCRTFERSDGILAWREKNARSHEWILNINTNCRSMPQPVRLSVGRSICLSAYRFLSDKIEICRQTKNNNNNKKAIKLFKYSACSRKNRNMTKSRHSCKPMYSAFQNSYSKIKHKNVLSGSGMYVNVSEDITFLNT